MEESSGSGGGCGCVPLIVTILVLWSLFFGLPTPWGKLNIDLFPPAIRLEALGLITSEAPVEIKYRDKVPGRGNRLDRDSPNRYVEDLSHSPSVVISNPLE
jgi:hypothetical protein